MTNETNEIAFDMLNEEQVQALNLVENTNFSFFLTGRAGTGKTTFLHYIQEHVKKQFVVVAPTGVAAILAGGVTIHSFFGMPFDPITPMTEFQINFDKQVMLRRVDTIIIDEVSMVRCDLIDGIDRILRKAMHNSLPFGGKQIIFSGDLYQLEPDVDRLDEGLMQFFREKYGTEKAYFYEAKVFSRFKLPRIEFKKVYRQTDERFLSMLDHIRSGHYNPAELMLLNSSGLRTMRQGSKDTLTLCARNDAADSINFARLSEIDEREITYVGKVDGDFSNKRFPVPQELTLKEGARVMFCRNDKHHRWVNGTVGTVEELTDSSITVRLDSGQLCDVEPASWENVTYTYNDMTKSLDKEVIGSYTQYPLKLAWAITIHKSQGMSFDRMNIDFSRGTFMPGQLYVALSRVTTLAGLGLSAAVQPYYITRRPDIDCFMRQHNNMNEIKAGVEEYATYNRALQEMDYDCAARECKRLMRTAIAQNNPDEAYYAAVRMLDVLFDIDILSSDTKHNLLPGDDARTLLLNAILALENGDYNTAVALSERGMLLDGAANFYFIKSIALSRMGNIDEAVAFNEEWQRYVRSEDNVIDSRCLYQIARTNFAAGAMFMGDMQSVISHNYRYIPAYETLRHMMHSRGLVLETESSSRELVDVFNSPDGDLTSMWYKVSEEAKFVLLRAIKNYPYDND